MAYQIVKYQAEDDEVHPMRLNSSRVSAAGTAPTGAFTSDIKVKVSKGNREFGIRPRGVRLSRTIGTAPNQFKKYSFLPVLTKNAFAGSGFNVGSEITVDSVQWTVVAKVPEDY